jgi:predicted RNase H-like HicB family nuclease
MRHAFTMEYWQEDDGYVGRLREVPGVFSQGGTIAELEDNLGDAYDLVVADAASGPIPAGAESKPLEVEV